MDNNATRDYSRKVQTFKQSEHFDLFISKITRDWEKYNATLRVLAQTNDPLAAPTAGKLAYIQELLGYFESKAMDELKIEVQKKQELINEEW